MADLPLLPGLEQARSFRFMDCQLIGEDLRLLVMSATLDVVGVSRLLEARL